MLRKVSRAEIGCRNLETSNAVHPRLSSCIVYHHLNHRIGFHVENASISNCAGQPPWILRQTGQLDWLLQKLCVLHLVILTWACPFRISCLVRRLLLLQSLISLCRVKGRAGKMML